MQDQSSKSIQEPSSSWTKPLVGNKTLGTHGIIILLIAGFWYFSGAATVYLENHSTGYSGFYIDNALVCRAAAETQCTARLYVWKPHTIYAVTYYGRNNILTTPVVKIDYGLQRNGEYEYIACGMLGTAGQNCVWFTKNVTPPTY